MMLILLNFEEAVADEHLVEAEAEVETGVAVKEAVEEVIAAATEITTTVAKSRRCACWPI